MSSVVPSVGVIICSSRSPRACPQIAPFVTETCEACMSTVPADSDKVPPVKLQLIDLAEWNLPMFDEPAVPSQIKHHSEYQHEHTRAWSREIQKHAAFIFVMPQYNWGYPAVLKNAIDYLFHEWHGKSAMIVSYGGHGGFKAAGQLREVMHGVDMNVAETMPGLAFPSRGALVTAAKGEPLPLSGEAGMWNAERPNICKAFQELQALVGRRGVQGP